MRTVIPRVGTYVEYVRLDVKVTSYSLKGHFNALKQYRENGLPETNFLRKISYLRTKVVASDAGCRGGHVGTFLLCNS